MKSIAQRLALLGMLLSIPTGCLDRAYVRVINDTTVPIDTIIAMPVVLGPLGASPSKEVYRIILQPQEEWRNRRNMQSLTNAGIPIASGSLIVMVSVDHRAVDNRTEWREWAIRRLPYNRESTVTLSLADDGLVVVHASDHKSNQLSVIPLSIGINDTEVSRLRKWRDSP